MRWLVTGASGFFGYFMCKEIVSRGEKCIGIDISDFEYEDLKEKVEFFKIDIRNYEKVLEVTKNVDIVIHAAAALPRWKPKDIIDVNFYGTKNMLEASLRNGVKRFVFISSTSVYGIPKKHPVDENHPLSGVGIYGKTKVLAEKLCEKYRKKGLNVCIIRPKTFVGPYRLGIFSILFDWVYRGKNIPIIGNGLNKYQLLDVRDLAKIIYEISKNTSDDVFNDVYNVGAKDFGTIASHVYILLKYRGKGRIIPIPSCIAKPILKLLEKLKLIPLYEWAYETIDKDHYVSIEKLIKKTGLIPMIKSEKSLLDSYKWYEKHRKEFINREGVTHRVQWSQGILVVFRELLGLL